MDLISLEIKDRLYWLGRYLARVYTTVQVYAESCDIMIDQNENRYIELCEELDIPNIYKDKLDFIERYAYDETDPNSIISNLNRAYDNAIVLREVIGSECLAYIQLAIYSMNKAKAVHGTFIELQSVLDNIMAFWGISDDIIDSENVRNIIKVGKRIERIDLYARMHYPKADIQREIERMAGRIEKTKLVYNKENVYDLKEMVQYEDIPYESIVAVTDNLVE